MNELHPKEEIVRREELVGLYVTALDANDFETAFAILERAQTNRELDRLINEVNRDYEREIEAAPFIEDAATVGGLLREHLPSAFAADEIAAKTVTLGDVARQIAGKGKIASGDLAANEQLQTADAPLPQRLSLPEIKRTLAELKIKASERFFRIFHETAILLQMKQGHQQALQAAREKRNYRRAQKAASKTEVNADADFDERNDETND